MTKSADTSCKIQVTYLTSYILNKEKGVYQILALGSLDYYG